MANLAVSLRPPESAVMDTESLDLREDADLRRLRVERWRIIYAVYDIEQWSGFRRCVAVPYE